MAGVPPPTVKLYSDDCSLLEADGKIVELVLSDDGKSGAMVLDQTCFHPQGGGQPSDIGTISSGGVLFQVRMVSNEDGGLVKHSGEFVLPDGELPDGELFAVGKTVHCTVDKRRRVVSTKLHSMGHLLDVAVDSLGFGERLVPGKGYHFEESPYVEYKISPGAVISPAELEALPTSLTAKVAELIAADIPTTVAMQTRQEAAASCPRMDLSGYPDTMRVVTLGGLGIPCGGTHVKSTLDLGSGWSVGKLKKKKDTYRVPYTSSALWEG